MYQYHRRDHCHLRHCYFTDLAIFTVAELEDQIEGLDEVLEGIALGKRFNGRRRTIGRQRVRVVGEGSFATYDRIPSMVLGRMGIGATQVWDDGLGCNGPARTAAATEDRGHRRAERSWSAWW